MHVAARRSDPRRFAAPAIAIAAAATVAVAPMSASAAITAPALPPIAQDLGGAASAVADWATATGLKFVTDPITGLTKLVGAQVEGAAVIGDAFGTALDDMLTPLAQQLPGAFDSALAKLRAGDPGGAYLDVLNVITSNSLMPVLSVVSAVTGQVYPQLGPIGDGLNNAFVPILMTAMPLLGFATMPASILTGAAETVAALTAGDPVLAAQKALASISSISTQFIEATVGGAGVLPQALTILPAILSGMAGSSWAGAGPFATAAGTRVSFAPASAATLAASPTALPALPTTGDFQQLLKTLQDGFAMLTDHATGADGTPGPQEILTTLITRMLGGDVAGGAAAVTDKAKSIMLIGLLTTVMPIADFAKPLLGPLGPALDESNANGDFIGVGLSGSALLFDTPVKVIEAGQNVVQALLTGDPVKVLAAFGTGAAEISEFLNTTLFNVGSSGFDSGLVPSLVNIGGNVIGAFTPAAKPADTVAPVAEEAGVQTQVEAVGTATEQKAATPAEPKTQAPAEPKTEAPVQTPAEPKGESPAEPKVEAPVQTPAEPKAETPAEPKVEAPVETPAEPKVEAPAEKADAPADSSSAGSADSSTSESSAAAA